MDHQSFVLQKLFVDIEQIVKDKGFHEDEDQRRLMLSPEELLFHKSRA